ncbi:MAG: Bro-N domain-containing protein [Rikenellaceae bacterium]
MKNKSTEVAVFNFKNNDVRVITQDGEPWFVAKDVAEILEYAETEKMTKRLDEDEVTKIAPPILGDANPMARHLTIINESGLYNAILGSKKPEAKAFKKWVTCTVAYDDKMITEYTMLECW